MYQYVLDLLGVPDLGVLGYGLAAFVLVVLLSLVYEFLITLFRWVVQK